MALFSSSVLPFILLILGWFFLSLVIGKHLNFSSFCTLHGGFPGGAVVKNFPANAGDAGERGFDPCVRNILWRRACQPTPVLLPGESHGQRSLTGYSPWARKESDTTERLTHTHACTHTHTEAMCSCCSLCLETFGSSLGPQCPETVSGPLT